MLERNGYRAAALNGDIAQAQRERVVEALKDGTLDIVIATDVAARGLDVPRITHVLNIDMPYDPESYVHRIGRTGRAGREGRALLLVTPRERRMLQVIERVTNQKVAEIKLPDAETVLEARLTRLANGLKPLLEGAEAARGQIGVELCRRLECTPEQLAAALLAKLTQGQALDLESVRREQPLTPAASRERPATERGERSGERTGEPIRAVRWSRWPKAACAAAPPWASATASPPRTCSVRSSTKASWSAKPSAASRCVRPSVWSSCPRKVW